MQDEEKLYKEIQELEQRWSSTFNALSELREQQELETRAEEIQRREPIIARKQKSLDEVENLIAEKKPENYPEIRHRVLVNYAHQSKRNGAYDKALDLWTEIANLYPNDTETSHSIATLKQLLQGQEKVKELRKLLNRRIRDIRQIFKAVVKRLNNMSDSDDDQMILDNVEMFINKEISADDFIEIWELLADESPSVTAASMDYAALAGRIQRSEIILFLGSDILREYDDHAIEEDTLAEQLAQAVNQEDLDCSLSYIAEYYELRNDYGRPLLLDRLHEKLPNNHKKIEFYHSLAKIDRPLILISTAYDNLLEQSFDDYRKPYVELSSIVNRQDEYDIGSIVIRYSDSKNEEIIAEEDLSKLNLLEQGYSLIYKIRGTSEARNNNSTRSARQDALTLMESDYFNFARYADRIIPGYIAKQFRTRDFLFLGYRPRNWEDRLLVNALLEKRGNSEKDCLMIGECSDSFEAAYWDKRKVKQYNVNVRHLDKHLKSDEA